MIQSVPANVCVHSLSFSKTAHLVASFHLSVHMESPGGNGHQRWKHDYFWNWDIPIAIHHPRPPAATIWAQEDHRQVVALTLTLGCSPPGILCRILSMSWPHPWMTACVHVGRGKLLSIPQELLSLGMHRVIRQQAGKSCFVTLIFP